MSLSPCVRRSACAAVLMVAGAAFAAPCDAPA